MSTNKVWTVRDVMIEDVVSVSLTAPFRRLLDLLWINEVSALPVLDDRGVLLGIVTESDLLVRAQFDPQAESTATSSGGRKANLYKKLKMASSLLAADVMTSPVVTVRPDATLTETARLMRERQLRRLPVLDEAGALVGMVSQVDLLKVFFRSEETVEWDVRDVIKRHLSDPEAIKVRVAEGVVHLEGAISPPDETERLVAAIDSVPGVIAVENDLG